MTAVPVAAVTLLLLSHAVVAGQAIPSAGAGVRRADPGIPLTMKLTALDGTWTRDTARGTGGICGVPVANQVRLTVTPAEIAVETNLLTGTFTLDGSETRLSDGRSARAALDAGWLAVTMRHERNGGFVNVMQEVYIVTGNDLTIWRVLNTILPDGTQGKIDCGNRHAIVYTRR